MSTYNWKKTFLKGCGCCSVVKLNSIPSTKTILKNQYILLSVLYRSRKEFLKGEETCPEPHSQCQNSQSLFYLTPNLSFLYASLWIHGHFFHCKFPQSLQLVTPKEEQSSYIQHFPANGKRSRTSIWPVFISTANYYHGLQHTYTHTSFLCQLSRLAYQKLR